MTKIIAEIGINHNGSINIAKDLIDLSKVAGCDYVKFQKRTPDICVPEEQKSKMRVTPWGEMAYIDYKKRIEFEEEQYDFLFSYCKKIGIGCFASVWDNPSVDFMSGYTDITKIPSALITNHELCSYARKKNDFLIVSTGMSTEEEIEKNVDICNPDVIMHTNSSYPSKVEELNLNYIKWLADKYPQSEIGYSGHEYGLVTTFAAVALGATWVERHITLDRGMWGSDHKSSIEPSGLIKLVKGIRDIEKSLGEGGPRRVLGSELDKRKSLRGS
jgi:N-acetylneuraminate synthase